MTTRISWSDGRLASDDRRLVLPPFHNLTVRVTRAWRWSSSVGASGQRDRASGRSIWCVPKAGRSQPSVLVPTSEFQLTHKGQRLNILLADSDRFLLRRYLATRPHNWPEAYAAVTIEANGDLVPYHDRQKAVSSWRQRMGWLISLVTDTNSFSPCRSGRIERASHGTRRQLWRSSLDALAS